MKYWTMQGWILSRKESFTTFSFMFQLHPSILFLIFGFTVIWGIVIGSVIPFSYIHFLFIALFGVFLSTLCRHCRIFVILGCIGITLWWTLITASVSNHRERGEILSSAWFFSGKTSLIGTITDVMNRKENIIRYKLRIESLSGHVLPPHLSIFLSIPENLVLHPWEKIAFVGKGKQLENTYFSYEQYGWLHNVYGQMMITTFRRIDTHEVWIFPSLWDLRRSVMEHVRRIYPDQEWALALGMILGDTHFFTDSTNQNFSTSGLSHLVAVSGSNIALVILFLSFFLKYLPLGRWSRTLSIIVGVVLYCALVGWNIPAIRAWVMGILSYLVLVFGRKISPLPLLILVALFFLLLEPLALIYDLSFELSFVAVWGLIVLREGVMRILSRVPSLFWFRESLVIIITAICVTAPILLVSFWSISLLSPLANLLVAPVIAIATVLGIMSVFASYVSTFLGFILGFIPYTLYSYIITVSHFISSIPEAVLTFEIGEVYRVWIMIGYLFFITWMSIEYMIDQRSQDVSEKIL